MPRPLIDPTPAQPDYSYHAQLVRVVDGDTVELLVDLGFDAWHRGKFRLRGINCPEMSTPEGKTAREFTVGWLQAAAGLRIRSEQPDKYGRWLVTIWKDSDPQSLNQSLLNARQAVLYAG